MLTLTDIKSQKLKTTEVPIEQWGGSLLIKKMSVAERDELAVYYTNQESGAQNATLQTIIRSAVNEDGTLMFDESHLEFLSNQDAEAITTLYTAILEFNGIIKKTGEDAVKP